MAGFTVHRRRVAGPATHAIVIGVSHYPHLNGGGGRLSTAREGMGQLSSPTVSARAFASWLIEELEDPNKPLASVALLLSERRRKRFRNPRTKKELLVEKATLPNVAAAIADWKAQGDRNPEHRLIFYFCGHGIAQGADVALLMADFGSDPNDALLGALDFVRFRSGMDACTARQQVYFVDACRASSDTLLAQLGRAGLPVIAPNPNAPRPPQPSQQPIYYSTLAGQDAYGRAKQPSIFTDALLRSFSGAGADDTNGDWRVETTQLNRAIDVYMQRAIESGQSRAQVPATVELSTFDLHFLSRPPVVPTVVQCQPSEETELARLSWGLAGQPRRTERPPEPRRWELELPLGDYEFRAELAGQPLRSRTMSVRPVERRVSLEAGP
ncbi:MAG TPA: caspase family protein [Candidatus Limnocylindria bacterium]|nr:caspase family protein [Candidatus Limnocylindria bacterium]